MNMKDIIIALVALVLLCLLGPVVVGILSASCRLWWPWLRICSPCC